MVCAIFSAVISAYSFCQLDIPAIVVDRLPATPPLQPSTRDITSENRSSMGPFGDPESPSPMGRDRFDMSELSIAGGASSRSAALQRSRRASDMSVLSSDFGWRYT
jgi:hypothetical protein